MNQKPKGYTLLVLLFAVSLISIGLLVAVPVWQTQIQREKEEELIFRGKQYIEAIRLYQLKTPGKFPETLEELVDEKCIRRLYRDPMTQHGEWNIIIPYQQGAPIGPRGRQSRRESRRGPGRTETTEQQSFQKVLIVPLKALSSVDNPSIIGVVSSSAQKAFKIYLNEASYDRWLFFYGMDPQNMPEIVNFGQEEKD